MTNKKAKKEIDIRIKLARNYDLAPDYIEILEVASVALEKQMPRKLSQIVNETGILALCQCGEAVQPPEVYCWACGQKLDWSEE